MYSGLIRWCRVKDGVTVLCVGARVHDRVICDAGTVRQTAAEGGGKVFVEYDDMSVSHGQQEGGQLRGAWL